MATQAIDMPTTQASAGTRRSLDALFQDSLQKYPHRPALFTKGQQWSYEELGRECRLIRDTLREAALEGKEGNIGLIYARDTFSYAAVLAIMQSNNVYVPLNPKSTPERLLKIIANAGIEALIVDAAEGLSAGIARALEQSRPLHIIAKEGASSANLVAFFPRVPQHRLWIVRQAQTGVTDDIPLFPTPAHLAYIIYTSGSTGVPKGVAITHESAVRCISRVHRLFDTNERDRFTEFSALSFDVSIADLFLCWRSGGALYVPEPSESLVPLSFVVKHAITVWSSVPSLANNLLKLNLLKPNALPDVRLALFCGEALSGELAAAWAAAAPASRPINLYGPTEVTIFSTYYEYIRDRDPSDGIVPIGNPLPGLGFLIVDDGRVVESEDTPGELWLSGDQLAAAYWNDAAATNKAFVWHPGPTGPMSLWYRTGDVVSRNSDVGLRFRGRMDRQVKLRGYRIELQEVESILREVLGCAVVAVVAPRNAQGLCEKMSAFCDRLDADEAAIKALCSAHMLPYLVPDHIRVLDAFPMNNSGKVDYLALAEQARRLP